MIQALLQFAATESAEKSGIAVLGIDPKAIALQLITFGLLFVILKRFAFKPIIGMLEQRRKTIDAGVRLGQKMTAEKEKLDEEVEKILHAARAEADKIIAASHQEAGQLIKEAEETITRKTDTMLSDARARIADDTKKARLSLERDMVRLVAEATEIVLQEKVDARKDASLLERALKGVTRS